VAVVQHFAVKHRDALFELFESLGEDPKTVNRDGIEFVAFPEAGGTQITVRYEVLVERLQGAALLPAGRVRLASGDTYTIVRDSARLSHIVKAKIVKRDEFPAELLPYVQ
jgi:hypothetical protein